MSVLGHITAADWVFSHCAMPLRPSAGMYTRPNPHVTVDETYMESDMGTKQVYAAGGARGLQLQRRSYH